MNFSERMGIVERSTLLQLNSMNDELRNSIWNVLEDRIWSTHDFVYSQYGQPKIKAFSKTLWFYFFKRPVDERPYRGDEIFEQIRIFYFDAPWNRVYEFVEFILRICQEESFPGLRELLNLILKRELAGYRIIEDLLVPITDQNEIDEISKAITNLPYAGAREHLSQSLEHLSNRNSPDYRNSIKESISAVESAVQEITGSTNSTLGDALNEIEKSGKIHGALKAGFSSIYGYTSDADGIRHGMIDVANLSVADAKYFLVACAAFVNYLVAKNSEAK